MSKKPVPKKKQAVSSTRSRQSKYAALQRKKMENASALAPCPSCGEMKRSHFVCEACGQYNGKVVLEVKKAPTVQAIEA